MKRLLSILLVLCIAASAMGVASAASLNGVDICPLMITEVAVWPGETTGKDVGELVEVYNNTDSGQDLYHYEMIFTTRRHRESNLFMAPDKFRGGFYFVNEPGKFILKSGEVAVLWLITDEAQKECTEAELREMIASTPGATPIPAGTQIIRIDTTDSATAFGKDDADTYEPCVRRDGVCYAMINARDAHKARTDANYGAFVRVYGQTGKGRSQTYALPTNDDDIYGFEKWQDDITGTTGSIDNNVPMGFGILAAAQKSFFPKAYPTSLAKNVVAGTETVNENLWLMMTEVAAVVADVDADKNITNDFGQLIEVYNNTSVEQDLYDYEMLFTSQRNSEPSQFMRSEKFRGGFYLANAKGKNVLKPGELAVIWIVFNDEQKATTEEGLRAFVAAKEGAAAIPADTQIARIDVTAEGTAFGKDMVDEAKSAYMPYVSRISTCYTMINKRDAHVGGPESDAANYGAFVRNYGRVGMGKSQTFGLAPNSAASFGKWQSDITKTAASDSKGDTDDNVPMNMGALSEGQPELFQILYTDPTAAIAAAKAAIDAIGEITMDNYTEKKAAIDAAQAAYDALVNAYEDSRSQVGEPKENVLKAAHEAYDNCVAAATKAADIAAVEKAITDIGEITADNYVEKKTDIDAAESARDALQEKYGEAVLSEIKNLSALKTAKDAYEGFVAAGGKLAEIAVLKKAIDDIGEITAENYTEKKAAIEAAESSRDALKEKYGDAVLSEVDNIETLNAARTAYDGFVTAAAKAADIAAVEKAITDIGEVTANNYIQKKAAIEAAENSRDALKEKYGDAVLGEISNIETLNSARTAYDGFVAAKAKAADIAAVERAITDIGEVTAENYAGKKTAIEAAESARDALKEKYGEAVLSEISNNENLNAAREAYNKFVEAVVLGDVNDDGDIDASDALLALQHSVELIKLEGDRFKAADVNHNATVDATDALLILQYSVDLITEFPKA